MTSQTSKGEVAKTGRCENAGFSKNDGSSMCLDLAGGLRGCKER